MIAEEFGKVRASDHKRMLTYAYSTAAWGRMKRMPSLDKVLEGAELVKPEEQTPGQMFAAVMRMHAKFEREEEKHGRR